MQEQDLDTATAQIYAAVDKITPDLITLSKNIHANPETAYTEYKAVAFIQEMIRKHGFKVDEKVGGIDTAFKAHYSSEKPGPTVAFLAEYDALPEVGHGCGHNLISAVSVGAAIALSTLIKETGGEIILMGTPAEERFGGKIALIKKGVFDEVDYALMTHPSTVNMVNRGGLATADVQIAYHGRSAHSSTPEDGINALSAVIMTFNMLDSIRVQMPLRATTNGIITSGGSAPNVITDYAKCDFCVRAATIGDLHTVLDMMHHIVESVEGFTGAKAECEIGSIYAERYSNLTIDNIFKKHMELQGEQVRYPIPSAKYGSSDIGNISLKMPAIHAYIKITDSKINGHSKEFAAAAITDEAHAIAVKAAKALACTGYEILTDAELRNAIKTEFDNTVPHYENL